MSKTFDEELHKIISETYEGIELNPVYEIKALIKKHLGEELVWEPDMTYGQEQVKVYNHLLRENKRILGLEE